MSSFICSKCSKEAQAGEKFCRYCGGAVIEVTQNNGGGGFRSSGPPGKIRCVSCNSLIDANAQICPVCGFGFASGKDNKKSMLPIIAILAAVFAVIIGVAAAVFIYFGVNSNNSHNTPIPANTTTPIPRPSVAPITTPIPTVPSQIPPAATPYVVSPNSGGSSSSYVGGGSYTYNSSYISESDLYGKSHNDVQMMINEVFARNGYIFKKNDLQSYYGSMPWYQGRYSDMTECRRHFSSIEEANVKVMEKYMLDMGWR